MWFFPHYLSKLTAYQFSRCSLYFSQTGFLATPQLQQTRCYFYTGYAYCLEFSTLKDCKTNFIYFLVTISRGLPRPLLSICKMSLIQPFPITHSFFLCATIITVLKLCISFMYSIYYLWPSINQMKWLELSNYLINIWWMNWCINTCKRNILFVSKTVRYPKSIFSNKHLFCRLMILNIQMVLKS